jgi:hypothetical protein
VDSSQAGYLPEQIKKTERKDQWIIKIFI